MSNGIYDVSLIAEDITNNCGYDTLKFDNLISCSGGPGTSINEKQQLVNIYPNPTKNKLNIVSSRVENVLVTLYSISGQIVINETNDKVIDLMK